MSTKSEVLELITKAKRICITTHINPDADGIGSLLAMAMGLSFQKIVDCLLEDPLPPRFSYLDPPELINDIKTQQISPSGEEYLWDLMIIVDTNRLDRIGKTMADYAKKARSYLFIDHHPMPILPTKELSSPGGLYYVNTKACATGEHCAELLMDLKIPLDTAMAYCLYTAMLVDTSSFRYPNVTQKSHEILAKLLQAGVVPSQAYNNYYGTKSLRHLRLLGRVLASAKRKKSWPFAYMCLEESLLQRYKVHWEDTNSFINYLLILDGIEVVGTFREEWDSSEGKIKGLKMSLRSFGRVDVAAMAALFQGGGHNHAAAAFIPGKDLRSVPQILRQLKKYYFNSVII